MDSKYVLVFDGFKNYHVDSKLLFIAGASFLTLYVIVAILVNIISKKRYGKLSIMSFIPIIQNYKAGQFSFNGYIGVLLIFMPFFVFLSSYYFPTTVCRALYVFSAIFTLICFIKLVIIVYNLSMNKTTIDDNGLIPNDFVVSFSKDQESGEEVISIKDMNDQ